MLSAEQAIVRIVQKLCYKNDLMALKSRKLSRKCKLYKLDPYLDSNDIIRISGRLRCAPIQSSARNPAVLSVDHYVSKLIVRDVHEAQTGHSGREHVISVLRTQFWIPQVRRLVD